MSRMGECAQAIELGVAPTLIQPVILCGGSGTRLWPLSREHHPKPLHALNGERALLQETGARCAGIDAAIEPLVICNEAHRFMVADQLGRVCARPKAIVLEPQGRGTAPALTLAGGALVVTAHESANARSLRALHAGLQLSSARLVATVARTG